MPDFDANVDQALAAYRYYIKGDRSIAWDPASRRWVKVATEAPPAPTPPPTLSARALERVGKIQDAERRGLLSHDAAEQEIVQILREET